MSYPRRSARVRVKLLLVLVLLTGVLGAGLVSAHYVRKRVVANRALAEGQRAFAKEDWPAACKHLKRYLSKYPEDVEVLEQFAKAELAVRPAKPENASLAIWALRRVLRERPDDLATARQLIKLYARTGQYEQAAYVFERLGDTDDVQATLWWARAMIAQRKFEPAAARLERLVEKQPDQTDALLLLADIAGRGGSESERQTAQRWLDRAVEADERAPLARIKRAAFLRTGNDASSAKADLEVAEQLVSVDLSRPLEAGGTGPRDADATRGAAGATPAVLHELAVEWLNLGEIDRAAAHIEALQRFDAEALDEAEIDPRAFALARATLTARVTLARGDAQAAVSLAERALTELQDNARTLFLPSAVELYVKGGRAADARRCLDEYREAIRTTGTQAASLAEAVDTLDALVMLAEDRAAEASERLDRLVARSPQNLQAWRLLALACERINQPRRATRAWEEYATRVPGDASAAVRLARAYAGRDWSKTLNYARSAESAGVDDPEIKLLRIEATLEQSPSAAQLAELATELAALRAAQPRNSKLHALMARLAVHQKRPDAAVADLERALGETDDPVAITLQLARLHLDRGHRDQAIEVCRTAITRSPDSAALRVALADLQRIAGQTDEARQTLEQAVADLSGDEQSRAKSALAQLLLMQADRPAGIGLLRQMADERPDDARAPLALLALAEIQSDAAEAARLVAAVRRIEGEAGVSWKVEQAGLWLRGDAWRENAPQIIKWMTECIQADPQWSPPALVLGRLYERLGEFAKAEHVYRQAADVNGPDLRPADRLLSLLERQRRFAEADELLQRLPANFPTLGRHRIGVALGRQKYDTAIEALQTRVAADPRDAEACVLLARLTYATRRDVNAAFKLLDQAAAAAPDLPVILSARVAILHHAERRSEALELLDAEVQRRNDFATLLLRAEYHALLEESEEAERDYQHLTTIPDSAADGYAALGRFYEQTGRAADAVKAWQTGLQVAPEHTGLQRLLAKAWLTSTDPSDRLRGKSLVDRLMTALPDDPEVLALRAGALIADNTPDSKAQAEPVLARLATLAPQHASAHLALAQLARQRGDRKRAAERIAAGLAANPGDVPLNLESARLEAENGNVSAAQARARFVIESDSGNLAAYQLLVALALRSGDTAAARTYNDAALKLDPIAANSRLAQAEILTREGRRAEALAALEEFRQSAGDPPRLEVLLMLAELYRQAGDIEHGGQRLDEAQRIAPQHADVLTARLRWLDAQQRYDDIVALAAGGADQTPLDPTVLLRAASFLAMTGQQPYLRAAGDIFDRLIALHPQRLEGHIGRAQVAYRLGNLDASEAAYRRVLEIDPNHQQTLNDLAWIVGHERKKPERGLELANRASLRYPDDVHLLDTRGVLLSALGRYEEARRDLDKCVGLTANQPETRAAALLHLARVYQQLGKPDEAKPRLAEAAQLDREHQVLSPEDRAELARLLQMP